jgi:hypothetical protein
MPRQPVGLRVIFSDTGSHPWIKSGTAFVGIHALRDVMTGHRNLM